MFSDRQKILLMNDQRQKNSPTVGVIWKPGLINLHEAYNGTRNNVNKLISNTKAKYFQDVISKSKNNPKEMWRNINQLIGKTFKTTNITSVKTNYITLTNNS